MDADRRVAQIASTQHGLLTFVQAIAAGLRKEQVFTRLRRGWLVEVHRGVYSIAGAPETWHQRVMAGCLAASGIACRRTAARLWQLDGCRDQRIELLVPNERVIRRARLKVHRTRALTDGDIDRVDGVPVTSVIRTLIDLGAVVRRDAVHRALENALYRRLCTLEELWRRVDELSVPGRPGVGVLEEILRARVPGPALESDAERRFERILRAKGMPPFVRQHRVGTSRIDWAYPEAKLGVEYDGGHHDDPLWVSRDRKRENELGARGWQLLKFDAALSRRAADVRATILQTREARLRAIG